LLDIYSLGKNPDGFSLTLGLKASLFLFLLHRCSRAPIRKKL